MSKKKSKKKVKEKVESVKVQSGQLVNLHYVGTFEDGTEFDSSREREESISCSSWFW